MKRSALAVSAMLAGAGAMVSSPPPASAHTPLVRTLAPNVGWASVIHNGGHSRDRVCLLNNVHTIRGDFRHSGGVSGVWLVGVPGCEDTQFSGTITQFRICDPRGCTAWKGYRRAFRE
jgi:hypothetical protein